MKDLQRALSQVIYTNNSFWRNPVSAFFTLVFPIMFLVIFSLIFGNQDITIAGVKTKVATFYVPAITGFSVITACYTNIAISLSFHVTEVCSSGCVPRRYRPGPICSAGSPTRFCSQSCW